MGTPHPGARGHHTVLLGLPGPVERTKLLAMATKIGVGESTRFLAEPAMGVAGLHVCSFNQVAATERWRRETLERLA